jgi:hypothetical protein
MIILYRQKAPRQAGRLSPTHAGFPTRPSKVTPDEEFFTLDGIYNAMPIFK